MFNKFRAKKVVWQGMTFDSQAELRRFRDLTWLQNGGVIRNLQRQVKYILIPNQYDENHKLVERAVTYVADFVYRDEHGNTVVEDVKGYRKGSAYDVFVIKRKLMLKLYGIRVQEVK